MLLRLLRRSFLLWFGAFFLCFGVVFLVLGVRDATRETGFKTKGVSVNAVVVSKSIRRAAREGNTSTKYEIAYRFRTDDGRTIDGVDAVGVDEWERLEPGRPFAITYLPGTPESSRAEGAGGRGSALVMAIVGTGFALVGGVLVWITGRRLLRHWRLLRTGQPGRGTVVAIRPTNVSVNRRQQWELRYRYQDHLGRTHEGTSGAVPLSELEGIAVDDTVEIRFDRERAEQSVWVPPANAAPEPGRRASVGKTVRGFAMMLAIVAVLLVLGERVPAVQAFARFTARHEPALLALTIGMTGIGFALFMGAIVIGIFSGAGATFHGAFTLAEAKDAWRRKAWRGSPRWKSTFAVIAGVLLFTVGLFGIFVVTAPAGIKLLCGGVLAYIAVRTIGALARA